MNEKNIFYLLIVATVVFVGIIGALSWYNLQLDGVPVVGSFNLSEEITNNTTLPTDTSTSSDSSSSSSSSSNSKSTPTKTDSNSYNDFKDYLSEL